MRFHRLLVETAAGAALGSTAAISAPVSLKATVTASGWAVIAEFAVVDPQFSAA